MMYVCNRFYERTRLPTTEYIFANDRVHLCQRQSTSLPSTEYIFAIDRVHLCHRQSTSLPSTEHIFAFTSIRVILVVHALYLCSYGVESTFYVLVAPVNLLDVADDARALGAHGGNE